jgi:hypothetical protein
MELLAATFLLGSFFGLPKRERTCANALYAPLQTAATQIRLIKLRPTPSAAGNVRYSCKMKTFYLEDLKLQAIQYHALSYTWGDQTQLAPFTVEINGNHVKVTENLGAAVGALAEAHESPWIWIDRLCINQADLEERNAQVSVMGRIYAGAYSVLA